MAKKAYVVLKLKDEFTKPLFKAQKGTKAFGKEVQLAQKSLARMTDQGMAKLTKFGKRAAGIAAGTAAAFAGMALTKGWSRMTKIDNAKVKLEAIGNSAEDVQKIMDNALASVKGTAYGMDAAATTAASAVAAGIKPGKKLESYLSSVADAAAVAGIEMDEMGAIFNKVATRGSANNEVLTQLSERGIPIYQYLAKEIGTTSEKVFEMAKGGEISLATFQKAVKKSIGGAAKEMGSKTITGAIANMGAAVSRIGANFIGSADNKDSFAGKLLPLLKRATEALGKLEDKAKDWGAAFGEKAGDSIEWLTKNFDKIKSVAKAAMPVIAGFYSTLLAYNGIMKVKKGLLGLNINIRTIAKSGGLIKGLLAANPILFVAIAIGVLVTAFITLYQRSEKFRNICHKVWDILKKVASFISGVVVKKFQELKEKVQAVIGAVKTVIDKFKELFGSGDKTINIRTRYDDAVPGSQKLTTDEQKGKNKALGTTYFAGGRTGFNELGPEAAILPSGTQIIPADKVGKSFGGGSVVVSVTVQGNVIGHREYMEETGNYIARRVLAAMGNV